MNSDSQPLPGETGNTCAQFLIHDPRLGEATWSADLPEKVTAVAMEILRPIREVMVNEGFAASDIRGGKPWGGSCCFGQGESWVSVFIYPVPSAAKQRWEGSIHVIPAPPLLRRLLGRRDRAAENRMTESVASRLKQLLPEYAGFTGIRWVSLQQLCASKEYEDETKQV